MPLFFCISGVVWKNDNTFREYICPKVNRLFIPWLLYFLFLEVLPMIVIEKVSIIKFCQRILMFLWSGKIYQGVYWYIPVLFLALVELYFIKKLNKKRAILVIIILYLFSITLSIFLTPENTTFFSILSKLPWNLDVSFLAVFYMFWGNEIVSLYPKIKKTNRAVLWCIFVIALFVAVFLIVQRQNGSLHYEMDMKYSIYRNYLYPVFIPLVFGILVYGLSQAITKVQFVSDIFQRLGKASMIIMYIHIPIRSYIVEAFLGKEYNCFAFVLFSCLVGVMFHQFLKKSRYGKFLC